jgi:hypothetical protein
MINNLDDFADSKFDQNKHNRKWFFTCNNPTKEDMCNFTDARHNETLKWLCVYKEIGEQGTPHLQGGLILNNNSYSITWLSNHINNRTHWIIMKGSPQQVRDYCTKDYQKGKNTSEFIYDDGCKENNKIIVRQHFQDLQSDNKSLSDINKEDPYFYGTHERALVASYTRTRDDKPRVKPEVTWIYGKTGSGKTRWAYDYFQGNYDNFKLTNNFFDGVEDSTNLLYDELRPDKQDFQELLEILGEFKCHINIKGGHVNLVYEKICVCSYLDPLEYVKNIPSRTNRITLQKN